MNKNILIILSWLVIFALGFLIGDKFFFQKRCVEQNIDTLSYYSDDDIIALQQKAFEQGIEEQQKASADNIYDCMSEFSLVPEQYCQGTNCPPCGTGYNMPCDCSLFMTECVTEIPKEYCDYSEWEDAYLEIETELIRCREKLMYEK